MKKFYTLFILVLASFFLSYSEVKADAFSINIDSSEFDLLNDEFYQLREISIEYANQNNKFYVIAYDYSNNLKSYIFDKTIVMNVFIRDFITKDVKLNFNGEYDTYQIKDGLFKNVSSGTNFGYDLYTSSGYQGYKFFMDTNYNVATTYNGDNNSPLSIVYGDYVYNYEIYSPFPSLYEIYVKSGAGGPDHSEEENILLNFYNLVIDRLSYLSTTFASNYIYLSVFVIFILVFVFELIIRRII